MATENLPALSTAKLPAHLAALAGGTSAVATSLLTGAPTSVPRISLKQGRFRIREGQDEFVLETLHLDAVIVGAVAAVSKMYYIKPWNPGDEPTAPDCHSIMGDKPAGDSASPQNDICATCPKNEWGSKLTPAGKEVKACADSRRMAVVSADDPEKVYLLVTPAASMRNLTKYIKDLSMHGVKPEMVCTRMSFDTEAEYPLLNFAFAGYISEEVAGVVTTKLNSVEVKDALGLLNVAAATPALPKPQVQKPVPQVQAPTPVAEPDQLAEPVKAKRGFGKAKATAAAPVAPPAATQKPVVPVATASSLSDLEAQLDDLINKPASV